MKYQVALALADGVGAVSMRRLVAAFGTARAVLEASRSELLEAGASIRIVEGVAAQASLERAEQVIEHCRREGVRILTAGMPEYPRAFDECSDAPLVLYVRGDLDFNSGHWLSIVGTRDASQNGQMACNRIVRDLALRHPDLVVVSGLAFGIDKEAHVAAMKYGARTVAVMAGWVDDIVPQSHYYLSRQILEKQGAIVSEQPPGMVIEKGFFLMRNRIIAALGQATIVVESRLRGGSLVTADIAASYNKELFALPGDLQNERMAGTNMLIGSNKAVMYRGAEQFEQVMGWSSPVAKAASSTTASEAEEPTDIQPIATVELPPKLQQAYAALSAKARYDVEALSELWEMPVWEAASVINQLRAKGLLQVDPYRCYYRG